MLGWAEATWPDLFPAGPATQPLHFGNVDYAVRFYAGTGNYTGVAADGGVWGYGSFTGNVLKGYGAIGEFTCLVAPDRCPVVDPPCTTTVASGFTGDLNAVYDAGGDGSADGDGGSAGVGGSEGKVLGARLRVVRLSDGALLGEGTTEPVQGLATVKWCKSDLPVLLQMQGAPGASYYDEAVGGFVPFPLDQTLHAMVERFDENVGVSSLTEAAYQYALATYAPAMALRAPGRLRTLAASSVPHGLSAEQVRVANARVLAEVNRRFTDALQQRSILSLATPIDQRSPENALPRNRYGRMAALTGAFATLARSYVPNAAAPALALSAQLSADLADGVLDGQGADGAPVADIGHATYIGAETSHNWTLGQGLLSQRFGRASTLTEGEPYLELAHVWLGTDPSCQRGGGFTRIGHYFLSTVGTVTRIEWQAPAGGCIWDQGTTSQTQLNHLTGIRRLVGTGYRGFAVTLQGQLWSWGWQSCGQLGDGELGATFRVLPRRVTGIERVVDVVTTANSAVALTADGMVYSWGASFNGLLGQGAASSTPCRLRSADDTTGSYVDVHASPTPRLVPGLVDIVALAASENFVNAVGADGRVYQWGTVRSAAGSLFTADAPQVVASITSPQKISAGPHMSFAIVQGRVAAWWTWADEIFPGQRAETLRAPQLLKNVDHVVDLVSDSFGATLALREDGSGLVWGAWSDGNVGFVNVTPQPWSAFEVRRNGSIVRSGLPRIVRLVVRGSFSTAVGADGGSYMFFPGRTLATSYWDATSPYVGLPLPY